MGPTQDRPPPVRPGDPVVPSDGYSRTKMAAESLVRSSGLDHCILRLAAILPTRVDVPSVTPMMRLIFDMPVSARCEVVFDLARPVPWYPRPKTPRAREASGERPASAPGARTRAASPSWGEARGNLRRVRPAPARGLALRRRYQRLLPRLVRQQGDPVRPRIQAPFLRGMARCHPAQVRGAEAPGLPPQETHRSLTPRDVAKSRSGPSPAFARPCRGAMSERAPRREFPAIKCRIRGL